MLVQSLADAAWRLNRVAVLETNLLTHDIIYQDFPNRESTHQMREAIAIAAALDSHEREHAHHFAPTEHTTGGSADVN